jgi:GntR family transcriptional regulator
MLSVEVAKNADESIVLLNNALTRELQDLLAKKSCTKRTAVRLAISNSIKTGVLKPGDYLPSEKALAEMLNVSLGTVQVALGQLQDIGLLQRRRGDGTRVADAEPFTENVWHFRFLSRENNTPLRITESRLKMRRVSSDGYWSEFLGIEDSYFRITRKVRMQDGTRAAAQMYIPNSLSDGLSDINVKELELVNIRPFLETRLDLRITDRSTRVSVVTPSNAKVERWELADQQPHYEINSTAFTDKKKPAYHQRILVAVSDCNLEF